MHFEAITTLNGALLHLTMTMLVLAMLSPRGLSLRLAVIAAAVAGLVYFVRTASLAGCLWFGVLLLVATAQLLRLLLGDLRAVFRPEEQGLLAVLDGLSRGHARHLIDQGLWLNGGTGDVLTEEGKAIPNLYFLAEGGATVSSGGQLVATCKTDNFIGEVTALSGAPATGTVVLDRPSRLWCVPADRLRTYADTHDGVRAALERAFRRALTEKLVAANATIAELSAGPDGAIARL